MPRPSPARMAIRASIWILAWIQTPPKTRSTMAPKGNRTTIAEAMIMPCACLYTIVGSVIEELPELEPPDPDVGVDTGAVPVPLPEDEDTYGLVSEAMAAFVKSKVKISCASC